MHTLRKPQLFPTQGRALVPSAVVVSLVLMLGGVPSWGQQIYNPTRSDPSTSNTAGGSVALPAMGGIHNTAFGFGALQVNNSGVRNTAVGYATLQNSLQSSNNTAVGYYALYQNTGNDNTAVGLAALQSNGGSSNVAVGLNALRVNACGSENTAVGVGALERNKCDPMKPYNASSNTAVGVQALYLNTSGTYNTAVGVGALQLNDLGDHSTAIGVHSLQQVQGPNSHDNIAVGHNAGRDLTSGSYNIYLGNDGEASENNTIRIGDSSNQSHTYIAGIYGQNVVGSTPVYINSNGQLGTMQSSDRYKRDIHAIGAHNQGLFQLRPVSFRYKQDTTAQKHYGLIAEEVDKVYPELVVRSIDGEIETVQYHELIPLLLNEVQHQHQELRAQARQLTAQSQQLTELKAQNDSLRAAMGQLATLQAQNQRLQAAVEQLQMRDVLPRAQTASFAGH